MTLYDPFLDDPDTLRERMIDITKLKYLAAGSSDERRLLFDELRLCSWSFRRSGRTLGARQGASLMLTAIKRASICLYCHGLLPARVTAWLFGAFDLRSL